MNTKSALGSSTFLMPITSPCERRRSEHMKRQSLSMQNHNLSQVVEEIMASSLKSSTGGTTGNAFNHEKDN
jgi:hypothetical protein